MTESERSQRVVNNIRAEAARRKLSQAELAEQVGIRQQALSRRMCGHTPFTVDELMRIADVLGVTTDVLLSESAVA